MKSLYSRYSMLLLAVASLAACTKKVDVKVPEIKDGLTLFCDNETGKHLTVVVGRSMSILKYNSRQNLFINNATVKLYANGALVETLTYNEDTQSYLSVTKTEPGKQYKITVEAAGYPMAEAEAEAPQQVPLVLQSIVDTTMPSPFGGGFVMALAITIQFNEPAATKDYYQLNFYSADQLMYNLPLQPSWECLGIKDASIAPQLDAINGESCVSGDIVFNDALFNGKSKQVVSSVSPHVIFALPDSASGDTVYPVFKLARISEARYRYHKSYKKAQEADGNPFAEPVNVYSNVKNGHGIFSISNPANVELKR